MSMSIFVPTNLLYNKFIHVVVLSSAINRRILYCLIIHITVVVASLECACIIFQLQTVPVHCAKMTIRARIRLDYIRL